MGVDQARMGTSSGTRLILQGQATSAECIRERDYSTDGQHSPSKAVCISMLGSFILVSAANPSQEVEQQGEHARTFKGTQ